MPYWRTFYHLVTATKQREPLITAPIECEIANSFAKSADDLGLIIHAFGAVEDHVHVALSIPPKVAVAEAVRRLKGASANRVNRELPNQNFGWQGEYGVLTFAERDLPSVVAYVLGQKDHHASGRLNRAMEHIDTAD
jgi:putative transposase